MRPLALLLALAVHLPVAHAQPTPSRLQVVDAQLVDEGGTPVVLRGVSLGDVSDISENRPPMTISDVVHRAADMGAKVIRLPAEPIYWQDDLAAYIEEYLDPAVEAVVERGLYAIVDLHIIDSPVPEDMNNYWAPQTDVTVTTFWNAVAPRYAALPSVIYELYNEPANITQNEDGTPATAQDQWTHWKSYAQPWVDLVRGLAPETVILVSGPQFSYRLAEVVADPFEGEDLAYVAHVYPFHTLYDPTLDPHQEWENNWGAAAAAVPVIVTEWGYREGWSCVSQPEGDCIDASRQNFGDPLRAYVEERGISWTAWAFDPYYEPAMFDPDAFPDWILLDGDVNHGTFVRDWLQETATPAEAGPQGVGGETEQVGRVTVYPTPTDAPATVTVDVVRALPHAHVAVSDLLGRHVATLYNGPLAVGRHTLTLPTAGLPSGRYYVRVVSGASRSVTSFTIAK